MFRDISRYRLARIEINPLPEATVVLDQHLQGARVAQSGEERDQDIAVSHRCGTGNSVADVGLAVMQDAILLKYFGQQVVSKQPPCVTRRSMTRAPFFICWISSSAIT